MTNTLTKKHCTLGLSGGVDSSIAAYLMRDHYDLKALYMKNWNDADCPWQEEYQRAVTVAQQLQIPISWVDGSEIYYDKVFKRFIADLHNALTPNPDIWCNEFVKFELLCQMTPDDGLIASGHYARILEHGSSHSLYRAMDLNKDQSYFLARISPTLLPRIRFPLGNLTKPEVRALASKLNLVTAMQKESMGICFIGPNKYRTFLKDYVVTRPGDIISDTGVTLGEHQGLLFYTLGQRKGHGIGGVKNHPESAWYVIEKNTINNTLVLSQNPHHPCLMRTQCTLNDLHWFAPIPGCSKTLLGQTRHRQPASPCHIKYDGKKAHITFQQPQWALTPGQHLVIYDEDRVIGSGIIQLFKDEPT